MQWTADRGQRRPESGQRTADSGNCALWTTTCLGSFSFLWRLWFCVLITIIKQRSGFSRLCGQASKIIMSAATAVAAAAKKRADHRTIFVRSLFYMNFTLISSLLFYIFYIFFFFWFFSSCSLLCIILMIMLIMTF